uniref:C-CAP/cofactor C-like domain-containing protein n=1 Tax=Tetranychus urticae TaxID=32264 RepID=T1K3N3_TETUR
MFIVQQIFKQNLLFDMTCEYQPQADQQLITPMGCLTSKNEQQQAQPEPANYSWNNRENIDPCEYTIENVNSSTVIKKPGSVNGKQFIVQNCQKSILCIFDYLDSATVDDCVDCTIFIGPTKGRWQKFDIDKHFSVIYPLALEWMSS